MTANARRTQAERRVAYCTEQAEHFARCGYKERARRYRELADRYAAELAALPPVCGRCHRELSDPASIERGYGPECAAKTVAA